MALFLRTLRAGNYTAVIDVMANPRTALQTFLTGSPLRVGLETRWNRNWAYTHRVPRDEIDGAGYLGLGRQHLLAPLGVAPDPHKCMPTLPCPPGEQGPCLVFLGSLPPAAGWVCLGPTHRHPVRRWPVARWRELASRLRAMNLGVVWMWGPGEEALVAECARGLELSAVSPLFSLPQAAFVAGKTLGYVGNSNGLSHVAAAGGARTLALHGPTDPRSWTPPDTSAHGAVRRTSGCVGCGKNTCRLPRRECLDDLTTDEVWRGLIQCGVLPPETLGMGAFSDGGGGGTVVAVPMEA